MYFSGRKDKFYTNGGSVLMEALICLPILLLLSLGVGQFAHIWLCRQVVQYAAFAGARAALPLSESPDKDLKNMTEEEAGALFAARRICALVGFSQEDGAEEYTRKWLPDGVIGGSGGLAGSSVKAILEPVRVPRVGGDTEMIAGWKIGKLTLVMQKPTQWSRAVTVRMDVPLLFPFAGQVIGKAMRIYDSNANFDIDLAELEDEDKNTWSHDYKDEFRDEYRYKNEAKLRRFFYPHIRLHETAVIGKPFRVMTTGNLPVGYTVWDEKQ